MSRPRGVIRETFSFIAKERKDLSKVGVFPVFLGALIFFVSRPSGTNWSKDVFTEAISAVVFLVPWIIVAIPWHRRIILEEKPSLKKAISWSAGHTTYLIIYSVLWMPMTLSKYISVEKEWKNILVAIIVTANIYLFARLSLVLPSIAIGDGKGIKEAWNYSKGKFWNIVLSLLGIFVLGVVVGSPWGWIYIMIYEKGAVGRCFAAVCMALMYFTVEAMLATGLSFLYKNFVERK